MDADEPIQEPFGQLPDESPLASLDREALADAFRAVTFFEGYAWIEEEPDYATADAYLAEQQRASELTAPPNDSPREGPLEEELVGRMVHGVDGRYNVSTAWEAHPTIGSRGPGVQGCTATMIGPSTAIAAAHCVYQGSGLLPFASTWRWGADDTIPFGKAYTDCPAARKVPNCWVQNPNMSMQNVACDYAVIALDACGSTTGTGNTTGWMGVWGTYGTAIDLNQIAYVAGYPANACPSWGSCSGIDMMNSGEGNWLQIKPDHLRFKNDLTGGQSGSGFYRIYSGRRYIMAIVAGSAWNIDAGGWFNAGRRITTSLMNWFASQSPAYSHASGTSGDYYTQ